MFQCVIDTQTTFNLINTWLQLSKQIDTYQAASKETKTVIYGHPPGLLGKKLSLNDVIGKTDDVKVGSLSVKTKVCDINLSALIFNTGKVKISGGLSKLECDEHLTNEEFDHILMITLINPLIDMVTFNDEAILSEVLMKSLSINASLKRNTSFGKVKYLDFIDKINKHFPRDLVTLPPIMQKDGKKRGRICAVKVKNDYEKKGSFSVDHSGNVQFFGYTTVEDLKQHSDKLLPIWL